jgi:excinuclease UvrABC nuclease subunit
MLLIKKINHCTYIIVKHKAKFIILFTILIQIITPSYNIIIYKFNS